MKLNLDLNEPYLVLCGNGLKINFRRTIFYFKKPHNLALHGTYTVFKEPVLTCRSWMVLFMDQSKSKLKIIGPLKLWKKLAHNLIQPLTSTKNPFLFLTNLCQLQATVNYNWGNLKYVWFSIKLSLPCIPLAYWLFGPTKHHLISEQCSKNSDSSLFNTTCISYSSRNDKTILH